MPLSALHASPHEPRIELKRTGRRTGSFRPVPNWRRPAVGAFLHHVQAHHAQERRAPMPRIKYEDYNPHAETERLLDRCQGVLDEYSDDGLTLTLRQLFYQLVSRDVIANEQSEYERLGRIVKRGRRAGYLDWAMIEDRGRPLRKRQRWSGPEEVIESAARSFHLDLWQDQRFRPEVWIEKDALVGVIESTCRRLDVPYTSCKGYTSDSALWRAAQRFRDVIDGEHSSRDVPAQPADDIHQIPVIVHLSDHDPSGVDMTRELEDRFELFGLGVPIERIALTMDQIRQYDPPPNYAKPSDSRFEGYVEKYETTDCWELDALDPSVIQSAVEDAVQRRITDRDAFDARTEERRTQKERLRTVSDRWHELLDSS